MDKKLIRNSVIVLFLCLGVLSFANTPKAVLKNIKGKVEVKTATNQSWTPAKEGMDIQTMTTISTGFDSSVTLEMADTTIFVKPLTRMTLDQLIEQQGTVKTSCYLRVGTVNASVKSAEGVKQDLQVQSPYSTASVRGTVFEFDGLKLKVLEGRVALIPGRPERIIQKPTVLEEDETTREEAPEMAEVAAPVPDPDFSRDFAGSPDITADANQEVLVSAGVQAEIKIQRTGPLNTSVSSDEDAKKKQSAVTTSDSRSNAGSEASKTKPNATPKYGSVVITITEP